MLLCCFFFNDTAPTEIYTLSLHDALPISRRRRGAGAGFAGRAVRGARRVARAGADPRSEEHTSELQSRRDLVCRLLLEKKKKKLLDTRQHSADAPLHTHPAPDPRPPRHLP